MLRPMSTPDAPRAPRVRHRERFELGKLLAAGDDDRHRARRGDGLEAVLDVVGLHVVRASSAQMRWRGGGTWRRAPFPCRPRSCPAPACRRWPPSTRRVRLWIDLVSSSPPTNTCTAIAATFSRTRLLDVEGELLVRQLLQDARAAAGAQHDPLARSAGSPSAGCPRVRTACRRTGAAGRSRSMRSRPWSGPGSSRGRRPASRCGPTRDRRSVRAGSASPSRASGRP